MLALLQAQREDDRAARVEQAKTQERLVELLAKKVELSDPGITVSKGKVMLVPPPNPSALALTGCSLAPAYALQGDTSSLDLTGTRHKIKSGRRDNQLQDARFAETWPNQFLSPVLAASTGGLAHDKLNELQWAAGFCAKIFSEIEESRNGKPEHNQLYIFLKMLRLADKASWQAVDNYIKDPLCENDEDYKRWRKAIKEAKEEE